jgi:hypothetical protein
VQPAPLAQDPPTVGPDPHDTTPRADPVFWGQMASFFVTGTASAGCVAGSTQRRVPCTAPYPKGQ